MNDFFCCTISLYSWLEERSESSLELYLIILSCFSKKERDVVSLALADRHIFLFFFSFTNHRIHSLVLPSQEYVSTGDGKTTHLRFSVVENIGTMKTKSRQSRTRESEI